MLSVLTKAILKPDLEKGYNVELLLQGFTDWTSHSLERETSGENKMKMLTKLFGILALGCLGVFSYPTLANSRTIHISIQTELGNIELELYPEKAPVTVANFLANIARGTYTAGQFYRSVDMTRHKPSKAGRTFNVIQGGKAEWQDDKPAIIHEPTTDTGLLNTTGTISMARFAPGTASSEFFINLSDNPVLDTNSEKDTPGYTAFGVITEGLHVAKAIQAQPTGNRNLTPKEKALLEKEPDVIKWYVPQLLDNSVRIIDIYVK